MASHSVPFMIDPTKILPVWRCAQKLMSWLLPTNNQAINRYPTYSNDSYVDLGNSTLTLTQNYLLASQLHASEHRISIEQYFIGPNK